MSGKCKVCHKIMNEGKTCRGFLLIDGEKFARERYGEDGGPTDDPCHDCNVTAGQIHHWGCDNERCPKCKGQALGCECPEKYEIVTETRTVSYIDKLRKEKVEILSAICDQNIIPNSVPKSRHKQFLKEAGMALYEKLGKAEKISA